MGVPRGARRAVLVLIELTAFLGWCSVAGATPTEATPAEAAPAAAAAHRHLAIDGGLTLALPAALPTGLSSGVQAGFTQGKTLAWGARVSWSSTTEYAQVFTVDQADLRLRLSGALQHTVGRGTFALRLGAGGTLVHEARTRDQGARAGLTGDALEQTAWSLLPALDTEVAVTLRVVGSWGVALSGGPSFHWMGGSVRGGWISELGVAWQN